MTGGSIMRRFVTLFILLALISVAAEAQKKQQKPQSANFYQEGVQHFNNNEIDQAIPAFQKAIKQDPQKPETYYYLGMCFLKKNNNAGAVTQFSKALDIK